MQKSIFKQGDGLGEHAFLERVPDTNPALPMSRMHLVLPITANNHKITFILNTMWKIELNQIPCSNEGARLQGGNGDPANTSVVQGSTWENSGAVVAFCKTITKERHPRSPNLLHCSRPVTSPTCGPTLSLTLPQLVQ